MVERRQKRAKNVVKKKKKNHKKSKKIKTPPRRARIRRVRLPTRKTQARTQHTRTYVRTEYIIYFNIIYERTRPNAHDTGRNVAQHTHVSTNRLADRPIDTHTRSGSPSIRRRAVECAVCVLRTYIIYPFHSQRRATIIPACCSSTTTAATLHHYTQQLPLQ